MIRRFITIGVALAALFASASSALAAFPGSNGKIAYSAKDPTTGANLGIWTVNPDGGEAAMITPDGRSPVWSSDGQRIAFSSDRDGNEEIYVMNADGSGVTRLTNDPAFDGEPSWSPDGQRIAFTSDRDGDYDIYVIRRDGNVQVNLTQGFGATTCTAVFECYTSSEKWPAWSPDGQQIAFSSDLGVIRCSPGGFPPAACNKVMTMNADGSEKTELAPGLRPDWSPDGSQILFQGISLIGGIERMDADGSDRTQLFSEFLAPVWSPDGDKIAFTDSEWASPVELHTAHLAGGAISEVTNSAARELEPDWQPIVASFKNASKQCKTFPGGYKNHGACVKAGR